MPVRIIHALLRNQASGGLILIAAAAAALLLANSPFASTYGALLHVRLGPLDLLHWVNDGLMAIFFLVVGLEIKREMLVGELASPRSRLLPAIAAGAGMAVPALAYLLLTGGQPELVRGWAIPSATDIAFALAVLTLAGPRVPVSLRLFLATVAIVDDVGAVAIIALAYTAGLNGPALLAAAVILAAMLLLNRRGVRSLAPYLLLAAALWVAVLASGVHATVAGVLAALTIPLDKGDEAASPVHRLEHLLSPWSAYLIVPVFGFANAGVSLAGLGPGELLAPLPLGIALGLFLGKQAGVFGAVWLAARTRLAEPPAGATWSQIYGVALLCGIGFTMSLFIGGLAFQDPLLAREVKLGVLGGSLLSALAGYCVLRFSGRR